MLVKNNLTCSMFVINNLTCYWQTALASAFELKKVNRENCFYNDAQWNGNYGKIFEKWKHDGTPYDINSVMHYAAHICSHNSEPVLVDKKTGEPVNPGKQKTNSLSGRPGMKNCM